MDAKCLADGKRSVTTQGESFKQNVGSPPPTHPRRSPDISINIFVHSPTHSHNHPLLQLHLQMPKTGAYVGGHRHRQGWKRQSTEKDLKLTQSSWTSPLTKPMKIKTKNISSCPTLADLLVMGAGAGTGEAQGPNLCLMLSHGFYTYLPLSFWQAEPCDRQMLLTCS